MKKIFTLLTLALCLAGCGVETKKTEKTTVKYNYNQPINMGKPSI